MEEIGGGVPVDQYVYNTKEYNWTWVFAKAYRVEFLRENGIRFAPENRWHEDTYFNYLCKYCAPKLININSIGYLWGFNADSITRVNNHEYTFGSLDDYFKSVTLAFRKILQEYRKDCYVDILHNILYYYYVFNEPTSKQSDKYERNEKIYYNFVKEFIPQIFSGYNQEIEQALLARNAEFKFNIFPEKTPKQYFAYLNEKYGEEKR